MCWKDPDEIGSPRAGQSYRLPAVAAPGEKGRGYETAVDARDTHRIRESA